MAGISEHADRGGADENDQIIKNVMENLSQYSTPPGSAQRCHVSVPDLFFFNFTKQRDYTFTVSS